MKLDGIKGLFRYCYSWCRAEGEQINEGQRRGSRWWRGCPRLFFDNGRSGPCWDVFPWHAREVSVPPHCKFSHLLSLRCQLCPFLAWWSEALKVYDQQPWRYELTWTCFPGLGLPWIDAACIWIPFHVWYISLHSHNLSALVPKNILFMLPNCFLFQGNCAALWQSQGHNHSDSLHWSRMYS